VILVARKSHASQLHSQITEVLRMRIRLQIHTIADDA
jgi:hypothetical protein